MPNKKQMLEEFTQHFEAAGFTDYYEKELKNLNLEEIKALYGKIFSNQ